MEEEPAQPRCRRCGAVWPAADHCPACGARQTSIVHSRETVLFFSAILLAAFFFLTGFVTRAYHQKERELAGKWFARGEQKLKAGRAEAALGDFRNALIYSPDNSQYEFRLALALAASGHDQEARSYLSGLLRKTPGAGPVNLALARLAAHDGSETDALRYYHTAFFGAWPENPVERRLDARLELCRYLAGQNDAQNAEAELVGLAASIPPGDAKLDATAGDLFLQVGDPTRALEEFRRALTAPREQPDAARGAGMAAYQLGDFRSAGQYLDLAHRENRNDAAVAATLAMSRLAFSADPFPRGLSDAERRERVRRAFNRAVARLESCAQARGESPSVSPPQTDLQTVLARAKAFRPKLSDDDLRRHPDQMNAAMDFVFDAEKVAAKECGPPQGLDEALTLIGKFHRAKEH